MVNVAQSDKHLLRPRPYGILLATCKGQDAGDACLAHARRILRLHARLPVDECFVFHPRSINITG